MPWSDRLTAPTPPVEGEGIEMETLPSQISEDDNLPRQNLQVSTTRRGEYKIGIVLLLLVVFLWTSSNFLTQVCLVSATATRGSDKPFIHRICTRAATTSHFCEYICRYSSDSRPTLNPE